MSFWQSKKLAEMSNAEWESLCDHCGKCCLNKLEDEDSGEIFFTSAACELLDISSCHCTNYANRTKLVPDCLDLRQQDASVYAWLPSSCAYRLIAEAKPLPDWHPLITGNANSTAAAGATVSSYAVKVSADEDLEDYIIEWLK